jgi:hypothetical protein
MIQMAEMSELLAFMTTPQYSITDEAFAKLHFAKKSLNFSSKSEFCKNL